jgi:hypothetical protein
VILMIPQSYDPSIWQTALGYLAHLGVNLVELAILLTFCDLSIAIVQTGQLLSGSIHQGNDAPLIGRIHNDLTTTFAELGEFWVGDIYDGIEG